MGFHDRRRCLHAVDLGDDMSFAKSSSETKDTLICNDPTIPTDESNLVIKALNLFRAKTGIEQYFWIELDKKVRRRGIGRREWERGDDAVRGKRTVWTTGDGGGFVGVERGDWKRYFGVFLKRRGVCTGEGNVENVEPPLDLGTEMLLVKPPMGCSTPAIFKALDLDGRSTADPLALLKAIGDDTWCSEGGVHQRPRSAGVHGVTGTRRAQGIAETGDGR